MKQKIKHDEETKASLYLSSLGFSPVHEPDGNVTPDFLVDGRIAIEVRRLNYNVINESGHAIGIESDQFALLSCMRGLLPTLGPPTKDNSWFVHYRFSRPLGPLKQLRTAIKSALVAFRDQPVDNREFCIQNCLTLKLFPSTKVFRDHFVLGGYSDHNTGGWLALELEKNIRICLQEKSEKIAKARAKYPEWWLILIDFISYGQSESLHIKHDWNKVIVLNPLNPTSGYEL